MLRDRLDRLRHVGDLLDRILQTRQPLVHADDAILEQTHDSRAPRISVSQPSVSTRTAWASALVAVLDAESSEIVFASASTEDTIVAVLSATSRTSWVIQPILVAARADSQTQATISSSSAGASRVTISGTARAATAFGAADAADAADGASVRGGVQASAFLGSQSCHGAGR